MVQDTKHGEKGCTVSQAALSLDMAENKDAGSLLIRKHLREPK